MKYSLILFILITSNLAICQIHKNMSFTEEKFWILLEQSKSDKETVYENNIINKLLLLSDDEIVGFEEVFTFKMRELYNWDAIGVLVLLDKHPTMPEHFWDFRTWVIAQRKDFYYSFLKNPDIYAKEIVYHYKKNYYLDFVGLMYVTRKAMEVRYKEKYTEDMHPRNKVDLSYDLYSDGEFNFQGTKWDSYEKLQERFPNLAHDCNVMHDEIKIFPRNH